MEHVPYRLVLVCESQGVQFTGCAVHTVHCVITVITVHSH
jgi:hypothetical protein